MRRRAARTYQIRRHNRFAMSRFERVQRSQSRSNGGSHHQEPQSELLRRHQVRKSVSRRALLVDTEAQWGSGGVLDLAILALVFWILS